MANSDVQADTYRLWKRFSLPVAGGSRDSIAVTAETGTNLVSAYTMMVKLIVAQLWTLVALAGMVYAMKVTGSPQKAGFSKINGDTKEEEGTKTEKDHTKDDTSIGVILARIFISKSSLPDVLKLTMKYFIRAKHPYRRYFSLAWMIAAALFLLLGYSLPIIVTRYLIIGHAAPVVPEAIYVPDDSVTGASGYRLFALKVPTALRAAGGVRANMTETVTIDPPNISRNRHGNQVIQLGYGYNITGVDLGLQHAPDLLYSVQGSCITEYHWFQNEYITNITTNQWFYSDLYYLWNDSSINMTLVGYNAGPPFASFQISNDFDGNNQSFGIIISSFNRLSFTKGTDPWYLTFEKPQLISDQPVFAIQSGRPALSCWQTDVWSYNGHTANSSGLENIPGLNVPKAALGSAFGIPMIVRIGQWLDRKALQSTSSSLNALVDAEKSSLQNDLTHLVFTSYLASKNVLADSTTYGPEQPGIRNLAKDPDGKFQPGAVDFVIYSNDIDSLSIRVIIAVPIILLVLSLLVIITTYKSGVNSVYKKTLAEYWAKRVDSA